MASKEFGGPPPHDSDVESLGSGGAASSTNDTKTTDEDDHDKIKDQLTKKETRDVFRLRITVLGVLFLAAIGVCGVVFTLTRKAELDEFTIQYEGAAEKVLDSFNGIFEGMGSISGLAVSETSHSLDHNLPFPFMTLTNFQEKGGNARILSKALYVSISSIVQKDQLEEWDEFVLGGNNTWMDEAYEFQRIAGINHFEDQDVINKSWLTDDRKVDPPHILDEEGHAHPINDKDGPYLLRWQTSPILQKSLINVNLFEEDGVREHAYQCVETESALLSGFVTAPPGPPSHENQLTAFFATLRSIKEGQLVNYLGDPMAFLLIPIFDSFNHRTRKVVGVMKSAMHWRAYLRFILPSNIHGITVVLENACEGHFTYEIDEGEAHVVGLGDLHDREFDDMQRSATVTIDSLADGTSTGLNFNQEGCPYSLHVYPSQKFYNGIITTGPAWVTFAVGCVFVLTIMLFLFYDRLVERRQRLILAKATQSTAIVSSLFPKQVRDRLMQADEGKGNGSMALAPNHRLKTFLNGKTGMQDTGNQPIADLFPNCTVLFSDISGFTAWSSTREPAQVFVLLQTVYQAFDALAKRRKVFKVETIGDSYVAVTGLPEAQANHAVIMARFSWECLLRMSEIVKELEVTLGPDTGDLTMRFGLHSGPVTAGVLRGERARFQLFGDTVNTAARMESTGERNKIQISQTTADLLKEAGKGFWLRPRADAVKAKGKGHMQTYWLNPGATSDNNGSEAGSEANPVRSDTALTKEVPKSAQDLKTERLVNWIVEILIEPIQKMAAVRKAANTNNSSAFGAVVSYTAPQGQTCLDEVKEVMTLPKFNAKVANAALLGNDRAALPPNILNDLREYVTIIAQSYNGNPFHNFEHACHVTMSVTKLLKRIVAPDFTQEQLEMAEKGGKDIVSQLHDYSHGIVSDPLTVFAIIFSALIHDVDHRGVSNTQLIKEQPRMGEKYRGKSVAEQNSLDLAWEVLMFHQFENLRRFIFGSQEELMRFRQLLVNVVLATDIFDKELNDLRKKRWNKAFNDEAQPGQNEVDVDLRATIVIEHIIQASDVSHTMQHWHVYQKWNKNLFREMYAAYKAGRMGANPADFWYQGELGFFDNYIIPLAKKLKECNVFGVSSDEYLNYAMLNREEWSHRGEEMLNDLIEEVGAREEVAAPTEELAPVKEEETPSKQEVEAN